MSLIDDITNAFVGRITFPLTNTLANRRNVYSTYARLMKSERYSREALRDLQLERLKNVIAYADAYVPFYTERFKSIGLTPQDIKTLDDVTGIPPLTRQEVIDHHRDMVDIRQHAAMEYAEDSDNGPGQPIPLARFRKNNLVRNTSSGSTGAPTVFYENGSITGLNWSNELRLRKWFGHAPGTKEARMARISTDYMPKATSLVLRKHLWHQLVLPGVNLAEEDYAYCLDRLREYKPRVIWGFTSAMTGLGDYMLQTGQTLGDDGPDLLIAWAAPLYDHERKTLTKAFDCSMTNIYGSREVGHIGALCPENTLHINQESMLVEIEEDTEHECLEGEGEILVTTFVDTPMPFIRYRMGDIGAISEADCPCGRKLQTLSKLVGRTGEIFKTKSGRMISPNFWCRTFMDHKMSESVKRFQIVYTKDKDLHIKIVPDIEYGPDTEAYLKNFLEQNFDENTQIEFEYLDDIAPLISGKYQMVVNESGS